MSFKSSWTASMCMSSVPGVFLLVCLRQYSSRCCFLASCLSLGALCGLLSSSSTCCSLGVSLSVEFLSGALGSPSASSPAPCRLGSTSGAVGFPSTCSFLAPIQSLKLMCRPLGFPLRCKISCSSLWLISGLLRFSLIRWNLAVCPFLRALSGA